MDRIRIVYAYTGFYRDAGGEMHPLLLAQRLDRERFDFRVAVFEPTTSTMGGELRDTGCPLYELNLPTPNFRKPATIIRALWAFYRLFRRIRPDIVQTQSPPANLLARTAARWAGVPVLISTENWIRPPDPPQLLPIPYIRDRWTRWIDRRSSVILAVSRYIVQLKQREQDNTPVLLSHVPFDLDRFLAGRGALPRCAPLADPERPVLGVVARVEHDKGQDIAIEAMRDIVKSYPGARLRIVGTGPDEDAFAAQAASLGLEAHVEFAGFRRDVCGEMAEMDVLLLPTLTEAISLVLIEAKVMGLPIVASRVGGVPEALADGAFGRLVEPGDPRALSEAVLNMLTSPEEAIAMASRAREDALSRYSAAHFVEEHVDLYEKLVAGRP